MSLSKKIYINNAIGINIGDNVMNFLFEKNTTIPNYNRLQYVVSLLEGEHLLEFYYGNNKIIDNNILFSKIKLPNNMFITIIGHLYAYYTVIYIYIKGELYNIIFSVLNNNTIQYKTYDDDYIEKLRIYFDLKILIINIKNKLKNININSKNIIINKLDNLYSNKDNFENQQLQDKIVYLKNKFII